MAAFRVLPVSAGPVRVAAGIALVLHGLAHAVFAFRGAAGLLPTAAASHAVLIAYSVALVTLVGAGVGLAGSRALFRGHTLLAVAGVTASTIALVLGWRDLWIGLGVNAVIVTWLLTRRAAPYLPPRDERRFLARTSEGAAMLFFVYVAAGALLWPWHRTWGTTEAEWLMALPGDPPVRNRSIELMHGISIDAPDWVVWAWLSQLGQDRAGFYSYDALERLFGVDIHNAGELRPEWQGRRAGERLPATQRGYLGGIFGDQPGWLVLDVQPCRALVLEGWGSFVVMPDGPDQSRLLVRSRMGGPDAPVAGAAVSFLAFELPHFIMERGMLRGIKARAESPRGRVGAARCSGVGAQP